MEISEDELAAIQCKKDAPFYFDNVSQSQLSVSRHYGGMWFDNYRYKYFTETDRLVRMDVIEAVKKLRRNEKKRRGEELADKQMSLFDGENR